MKNDNRSRIRRTALVASLTVATACYSGVSGVEAGGAGDGGEAGSGEQGDGDSQEPADDRADPHVLDHHTAPGLRRLTKFEYGNTVRDLLGVEGAEALVPGDSKVNFHTNNAHMGRVGLVELGAFAQAAEAASSSALETMTLPDGCVVESFSSGCAGTLLQGLLPRAFRRPATAGDIARYQGLFDARIDDGDSPSEALRVTIEAILMSPHFMYRSEVGMDDPDEAGPLESYAIASRLSYLLWGTMPDDALFDAASTDALQDPEVIEAQVHRMLESHNGHVGVLRFTSEWLGFDEAAVVTKDDSVTADLPPTLQEDLEEETRRFVADALLGPSHSLDTLLTATYTFANATVATIYGVDGIDGDDFRRTELDPTTRRGILTQPLVLAGNSKETGVSAVQMGHFVRERLLCQPVPPPPPDVEADFEDSELGPDATFRELLTELTSAAQCSGCHELLNAPGFAFLPYDPIGRYSATDAAGRPFVTAGTLVGLDGDSVEFADASEMIDAIAASDALHGCFTRHYLEYAFGRTLALEDVALYHALVSGLQDADGDFVGFVTALVTSPEFASTGPRH